MDKRVNVLPKWVLFATKLFKIIDTSHFSGRIPPNMDYPFALPRSRRPKPASRREGRVLFVWMMG
jgi:hypothetical protein